ncbi:ferritin-like domain-containing protein [Streptomyces sp. NBC_00344]|uniref:ferritin-like domain-containing protein n=1 Tax=Streptomyces sp. NBC_00344 TaxID=2975720 RepID=UPI002E1E5BED
MKSATLAVAGPAVVGAAATPAKASVGGAVARLMDTPGESRDAEWIKGALQVAVELELATIPPYLCAWWSIKDRSSECARLIAGIINDEMYHMGLVCNLLAAVGGTPRIADAVPSYPGPLPGGVRQGLTVYLSGLTKGYVHDVMMAIEAPEAPLARVAGPPSIGSFYTALLTAFHEVGPALSPQRQLPHRVGADNLVVMRTLDDVERAIEIIKEQGEGTDASPDAPFSNHTPAHYYAFGEIYHERRLSESNGVWEFTGAAVPFPDARPMEVVPSGGWPSPAGRVQRLLREFDRKFTTMLNDLEDAWATGDPGALDSAVRAMRSLESPAISLMGIPTPGGSGTYGPQFRSLPRRPGATVGATS